MTNTTAYGYIGALVAIIGWGISKAPMKMPQVRNSGTDLFVFQLYNSATVFVVSFLALAFVDFNWTPWGILGGAFWVPGSVLANYAVNYLGLAVAQGTWAGTTMIVSFLWGVIFFGQKPKSPGLTFLAFVMILVGIAGVTFARKKYYYLKVEKKRVLRQTSTGDVVIPIPTSESKLSLTMSTSTTSLTSSTSALNVSMTSIGSNVSESPETETPDGSDVDSDKSSRKSTEEEKKQTEEVEKKTAEDPLEVLAQKYGKEQALKYVEAQEAPPVTRPRGYTISLEDIKASLEKRKKKIIGFVLAVMMGVLNASIFIPTELIDDDQTGITYIVSYGIGIGIVTPFYGLLWFGVYKRQWPVFNWRPVAWPAFISGALVAIGNAGSTIATKYLGYGIGYPLTQLSLLVAGVYGMIIYGELQGLRTRTQYLLAALVLLCGALVLALFGRE